jgi:hypothetical protein
MSKSYSFLIFTPPYWNGSAGIFAMHRLANNLGQLGYHVVICFYNLARQNLTQSELNLRPPHFFNPEDTYNIATRTKPIPQDLSSYIVIYPETLPGNPLKATNVVRYVMNFPSKNMHPMIPGKDDFILAYWSEYFPENHFTLPIIARNKELENISYQIEPFERKQDCTYIGKGVKLPGYFEIDDTIYISREWPKTKKELYSLLSKTKFLFSWDPLTSLTFEALICGAIPVFLRFQPYFDSFPNFGLAPYPYATGTPDTDSRTVKDIKLHFQDYNSERLSAVDRYLRIRSVELLDTGEFAKKVVSHFSGKAE